MCIAPFIFVDFNFRALFLGGTMLVEFWIRDLYQFVVFEHFIVWNLLWKILQQLVISNGL